MKTLTLTIELLKKHAELLIKALVSEPAKAKEVKNEDGSREICLFCGKSHDQIQIPLECQIKGAGMSALWSVLDRVEAMQIADRTAFLSELTTNMMKIIPQSDSLKHSKALEIMSRLYGFKDYHQAEIELTKEPKVEEKVEAEEEEEEFEFVIGNEGKRDIKFIGRLIGSASTSADRAYGSHYSGQTGIYNTLSLYKTNTGKYVCSVFHGTQWQGSRSKRYTKVCTTTDEIVAFLIGQFDGEFHWIAKELLDDAGLDYAEKV